jgi:tetratricopeptide (TPR) repeat protein
VGTYFLDYELNPLQAMQFYDKALVLSKSCGNTNHHCKVLLSIAQLKERVGDYNMAQIYAREAYKLSKLSGYLYDEAQAHWVLAECLVYLGNYYESTRHIHRAKEIIGICGLSGGYVDQNITLQQADIYFLKSEYTQSWTIFSHIAKTTSIDQNAEAYGNALLNVARIDITIGHIGEDVHYKLNKAREIFKSVNNPTGITCCDIVQADAQLKEEQFEIANIKLQKCLQLAWGTNKETESLCLDSLANIKAWPAVRWQSRWPAIYLGFAHQTKGKLALYKALLYTGDLFLVGDDEETAFNLYTVALDGFTHMDVHQSRAQCMLRLGDLLNKQGNVAVAIDHSKAARPLFERSTQAKDIAEIDSRLATINRAHQDLPVQFQQLFISGAGMPKIEVAEHAT